MPSATKLLSTDHLRSRLATARTAWCRGDYDGCLSALNIIPERLNPSTELIADGLILRSRARLRTNRAQEVVDELCPILDAFTSLSDACTAEMLHATAVARAVDVQRGIGLLDTVYEVARNVHASIRVETLYYKALALWTLGQYREADTVAQRAENAQLGLLSVRATELRAYCAIGLEQYGHALDLLRAAHEAYNWCSDHDAGLAGKIVLQIANLEQTLCSAKIRGSHERLPARTFVGEQSSVLSFERMRTLQMDGWLYALDGNGPEAFRCLDEAQKLAPSSSWRIGAIANRGLLAFWFGEELSAAQHIGIAEAEAQSVNWTRAGSQEELVSLVALIEAMCAVGLPAGEMMRVYDRAASTVPEAILSAARINRSYKARVDYLRGLIQRSDGDHASAQKLLLRAYEGFCSAGHLWRAALALIEVDATQAAAAPRDDFHLETAALLIRKHFPQSFLAKRLGCWGNVYRDQIARALTPAQREVLRYALDGHGAVETAALTGRAEKTVRKHLTALHDAFGVKTTLRLVAACHARGLAPPARQSTIQTRIR